jgi:hypothetical protein
MSKKINIQQLFRNCTTMQMPVCMPMELILNLKKGISLLFKKKISPETFGLHCVYYREIKVEHPHTVTCQ